MKVFLNAPVYLDGEVKRVNLQFNDRIAGFGTEGEAVALPDGAVVFPGFIDGHIHGAGGADAMDASVAALDKIARTLVREGTTGFLATTMTESAERIASAVTAVREYIKADRREGAALLGVHLEGPFISPRFKGAQCETYIRKPDRKLFGQWQAASGNAIRTVTLTPEAEGAPAFIRDLAEQGVIVSLGHSAALRGDVERAIREGASSVTHTFNAMSPLHHRDIGLAGSALLYDELNCELIADGIHVSLDAMRLLFKNKPNGKITLITDAIRAKGLGDGESELGGQKVYVKNGEARLEDGTLAGSVLKMNEAVRLLVKKAGIPLARAVDAATVTPARMLGLEGETGSIAAGKRADFAVLDGDFNVLYTFRNGEAVFRG